MKSIRKILVVGGGTAGCISALLLKTRFPQFDIQIIESSKIGIVGVGESSTEHWKKFCEYVGLDLLDAVIECDATFKASVYFENWGEKDYVYNISPPYNSVYGSYFPVYAYLISQGIDTFGMCDPRSYVNEIGVEHFLDKNDSPTYQFHFDNFALNEYLHRKCEERGIKIIEGDIVSATTNNETGDLTSVITVDEEYHADFFIDCSGFAKLLMGKVYEIPWKSYEEQLPLDSAFVFQTEEMEEYNKYPISTARDAGWSFTIPTQKRTGNGYVYNSSFINRDDALKEMEIAYGKELTIGKEFKFTPGRLEKSWTHNCFAAGLSQSFVEPLEGTSIGSIIQSVFCFMDTLPSYDSFTCNTLVNDLFDNIIDFIQAHYLVQREDTAFWKEIKYNLKLTDNLSHYLSLWKHRLPLTTDIHSPYGMFQAANYIPILHGLNWFDVDKIRQEYYQFHAPILQSQVKQKLTQVQQSVFPISHKKFIKEVIHS